MEQTTAFIISLVLAIAAGIIVPRISSLVVEDAFPGKQILKGKVISTDAYFARRILSLVSFIAVFAIAYIVLKNF